MNNKTFTNKLDIAEEFNKYFISVGPSLASTIDHYNEEPTKYIYKSPVSSFIMSPVGAPTKYINRSPVSSLYALPKSESK